MKCPECNNDRWFAQQNHRVDIIVNEFGEWEEDLEDFYTSEPYPPFICTECGYKTETLDEED